MRNIIYNEVINAERIEKLYWEILIYNEIINAERIEELYIDFLGPATCPGVTWKNRSFGGKAKAVN